MREFGAPPLVRTLRLPHAILAALALAPFALSPFAPSPAIAKDKWAPVPAADMALQKPTSDKEAGAEVLLWSIWVEDQVHARTIHTFIRHELRTKVFTARGAEEASRVDIVHERNVALQDIAARTIRPDGTVVELSKDQIFDRTIVKDSDTKLNTKSFAFPAVTPGAILEYRWTEIRYEDDAGYTYLEFQRDYPVRQIDLHLKPLPIAGDGFLFKMRAFNMATPAFVEEPGGFQYAVLPPMPARRKEPFVPPTRQVTPWAIFYYQYGDDPPAEELWSNYAEGELRALGSKVETKGDVGKMALEISAAGDTAVRKADLIYDWCRTQITDISDDRLALGDTERQKEPKNRTPAETLQRRRGRPIDIVYLFYAMCRSIDIPARLVSTADRSDFRFDSRLGLPRLLTYTCAAVPQEKGWRFYDPSEHWLGPGYLAWTQEGEEVLLLDAKKPEFARTPLAPPESSIVLRSAHLRLAADGTAAGSIRKEFRGHRGASRHEKYDELSPEARVDLFRKDGPLAAKEASYDSIRIDGADEPLQPVVERATLTIPGYAQPVGDRLLVPLSLFMWKAEPEFPSPTRYLPIEFVYPWAASDTVTIELPDEYEVEALPESDPPVTKGVARFSSETLVSMDGRSVLFIREFSFGVGGVIRFPVEQYPSLKKFFDEMLRRDEETLALRRKS